MLNESSTFGGDVLIHIASSPQPWILGSCIVRLDAMVVRSLAWFIEAMGPVAVTLTLLLRFSAAAVLRSQEGGLVGGDVCLPSAWAVA